MAGWDGMLLAALVSIMHGYSEQDQMLEDNTHRKKMDKKAETPSNYARKGNKLLSTPRAIMFANSQNTPPYHRMLIATLKQ